MSYTMERSENSNGQSCTNQEFFIRVTNETPVVDDHMALDSGKLKKYGDFKEDSSVLLSFEKDLPDDSTMVMQSSPGKSDSNCVDFDPSQSTPLVNAAAINACETSLPFVASSDICSNSSQQEGSHVASKERMPLKDSPRDNLQQKDVICTDMSHNETECEGTLKELSGDESSLSDPSSPRTLSRQSSAFGNVTLEFDWETSMKGMLEETSVKPQYEEKHKVILHELSFEDHHRLKAPELLCPVFLAVQVDDFEDDEKKLKQMSQSIDDLCEMISDDREDEQDLPKLRRRAKSLECKKPPSKEQRKKVPTKEELMAAFEELQQEIMEDKDLGEQAVEKASGECGGKKKTPGEAGNEQKSVLEDPLRWHTVVFNGHHKVIDLKLLEPYLKVLTHGGYHHEGNEKTVIVVLTACNLPDKKLKRYPFLMEQLFFFIISTMDLLVTSQEYIFVYFHGGTSKYQSPSFSWLKKYYQYIDHRLRKSVTKVFVVHPNLWLKSICRLCRPFLSSNFARKLKFVNTLKELSSHIKTDFIFIPDEVRRVDPDYRKLQDR